MSAEPAYYTTREVAHLFRVSPQTVTRWVTEGRFPPPLRVGRRRLLWDTESVRRLLRGEASPAPGGAA
jgi:excisionase family DNA binding protein